MSSAPIIVIARTTSADPAKRDLEEHVAATLADQIGVDVRMVPHIYDLKVKGPAVAAMRGLGNDLIVLAWLYPRATHWTLDQLGMQGRCASSHSTAEAPEPPVEVSRQVPDRMICCLDLRDYSAAEPIVAEVRRMMAELRPAGISAAEKPSKVQHLDESAPRRWYPVIDFSRCTNCMECIDFCLFGVYGVDRADKILVEQPDNCRKGCPACSRVCPTSAIIFPQHKTPGIAGADGLASDDWKLDLSDLFGGLQRAEAQLDVAACEREQHRAASESAVTTKPVGDGATEAQQTPHAPDELDRLVDEVEGLDL